MCILPNKIKGYRVMLGLSQKDIATTFGISAQAYSMKERGITSFNDEEKKRFVQMIKKVAIDETVGSIFFNELKTK